MKLNRFQKFRKQLKDLGYSSYDQYLHSSHWEELKNRYRRSKLPQNCRGCGSYEDIQFHHRTYKDLGHERTDQIIAVCKNCHKAIHDSINQKMAKGNFKWNLWKQTKIVTRKVRKEKGSGLPTRRKSSAIPQFYTAHSHA